MKNATRLVILKLALIPTSAMAQTASTDSCPPVKIVAGQLQVKRALDYTVFRSDGSKVETVADGKSLVELPPGKYVVEADSATDGRVKFSVLIRSGRTTSIVLESPKVVERAPLPDELPGSSFYKY